LRPSILDKLVDAERGDDGNQKPIKFDEVTPWPEAVDGAELLDAMAKAIRSFVVMPDKVADAVALWVVHTYAVDAFGISPRLAIMSPQKGCGKSTLLDVLSRLVHRAYETSNTSASALFRLIARDRPCLLIDEADTFMLNKNGEPSEVLNILNSGHKRGGGVTRTVGEDHEPMRFETFAAGAIALIGKLPAQLHDRSIPVSLQRRMANESIERLYYGEGCILDELARKITRWMDDNGEAVAQMKRPPLPARAFNRLGDNWRPLFAIAEVVGREWPQRCIKAFDSIAPDDDTIGTVLLMDIRAVFAEHGGDRMTSLALCAALAALEGRPWAEWGKSAKPITQNQLARLLKPYQVSPVDVRTAEGTRMGYVLDRLERAFERYIPSTPLSNHDAPTSEENQPLAENSNHDEFSAVVDRDSRNPLKNNDCRGVVDQKGGEGHICRYCGRGEPLPNQVAIDGRTVWLHPGECEAGWMAEVEPDKAPPSPKGVKFMITNVERAGLYALGWSKDEVDNMTPAQAEELLARREGPPSDRP
jgi:hypothetical protein